MMQTLIQRPMLRQEPWVGVRMMLCMAPLMELSLSQLEQARTEIEKLTDEEKELLMGTPYTGGSGARAFNDFNLEDFLKDLTGNQTGRGPEVAVKLDEQDKIYFEYAGGKKEDKPDLLFDTDSLIRTPRRILRDINWVVNATRTMYEVVLKGQEAYLRSGKVEDLKVLTQDDVATEMGIDPSTVSRLAENRSVRTPQGDVLSLKSLMLVEETIKRLRAYELIGPMLRDETYSTDCDTTRLVENRLGLGLKRRTIAKYRKALDDYIKRKY